MKMTLSLQRAALYPARLAYQPPIYSCPVNTSATSSVNVTVGRKSDVSCLCVGSTIEYADVSLWRTAAEFCVEILPTRHNGFSVGC